MNMAYNTHSFFVLKGYKTHFVQGGVGYKVIDKVFATGPIPDTIMIFGDLTGKSCFSTPLGGIGDTTYILLTKRIINTTPLYPQIDSGDFRAWLCEYNTLSFYHDSVYAIGWRQYHIKEQDFIDSIKGLPLSNRDFVKDKSSVAVYPNPVQNYLNINTENDIKIERVSLFNAVGQKSNIVINNNKLDLSHIPDGLYILYLHTNKGILPKKVIVNH